jgi:ferredoxin
MRGTNNFSKSIVEFECSFLIILVKMFRLKLLSQNFRPRLTFNTMRFHAEGKPPTLEENPIKLFFAYTKSKEKKEVLAREGESLLDVAHNNGIELEGACESSLACSTCHVILEQKIYD